MDLGFNFHECSSPSCDSTLENNFSVCFVKKDGSERIMNCRLLAKSPEIVLGYVKVIDLDKGGTAPDKKEIREVDLRNVLWLVLDGVKYTLSK